MTVRGLQSLGIKHYRTQALFELHTLVLGLDVLGNPVSVVKGLVEGTVDLFYEPFKVDRVNLVLLILVFISNGSVYVRMKHDVTVLIVSRGVFLVLRNLSRACR